MSSVRLILLTLLLISTIGLSQPSKVKPYAPEIFHPGLSGAVCGFSDNGNTIYFVREDTTQKKLYLYEAKRNGRKWVNEQVLSFSGEYNDMGGRLSPDGRQFYFTSDRPGGSSQDNDEWNLWVSNRINNQWSEPIPLTAINNKGLECCPVPMENGTLIFSSDRGKGQEWRIYSWNKDEEELITVLNFENGWQWPSFFVDSEQLMLFNSMKRPDTKGKDDIYISFYSDNSWSPPTNIGSPVNTSIYEDGAILSPDGKYLIFNQHETGETPSKVMHTKWKPILTKIKP